MGKLHLQCPGCGGTVEPGDAQCRNCGINLKSGETFQTQAKRAREKGRHPEHFGKGLSIGLILSLGLFMFVGYRYQRSMTGVMQAAPDLFREPVARLQHIDDLIYTAGHSPTHEQRSQAAKDAQQEAESLILSLDEQAGTLQPRQPHASQVTEGYFRRRKKAAGYNERAAKRLLLNLKAKAEMKLNQIPVS